METYIEYMIMIGYGEKQKYRKSDIYDLLNTIDNHLKYQYKYSYISAFERQKTKFEAKLLHYPEKVEIKSIKDEFRKITVSLNSFYKKREGRDVFQEWRDNESITRMILKEKVYINDGLTPEALGKLMHKIYALNMLGFRGILGRRGYDTAHTLVRKNLIKCVTSKKIFNQEEHVAKKEKRLLEIILTEKDCTRPGNLLHLFDGKDIRRAKNNYFKLVGLDRARNTFQDIQNQIAKIRENINFYDTNLRDSDPYGRFVDYSYFRRPTEILYFKIKNIIEELK